MNHNSNYSEPLYNYISFEKYTTKFKDIDPQIETEIKKRYKKLKKMGIDSEEIQQYLLSFVKEYIAQLYLDLEKKHIHNTNLIDDMFSSRAFTKEKYGLLISTTEDELSKAINRYKYISELYTEHNPLYQKTTCEKENYDET